MGRFKFQSLNAKEKNYEKKWNEIQFLKLDSKYDGKMSLYDKHELSAIYLRSIQQTADIFIHIFFFYFFRKSIQTVKNSPFDVTWFSKLSPRN